MTWLLKFDNDTDNKDIGTMTATWTDEGESHVARFEQTNKKTGKVRTKAGLADLSSLANESLATYRAEQAKADTTGADLRTLEQSMNAAIPASAQAPK